MEVQKFARSLCVAMKFSANNAVNLLSQLASPEHALTRAGGPGADHVFRGVVADSLQDEGDHREPEAQLLRDPNQHVVVHDGKVKKGRYTEHPLQRALSAVDRHLGEWAGNDNRENLNLHFYENHTPISDGMLTLLHEGDHNIGEPDLHMIPHHQMGNRLAEIIKEYTERNDLDRDTSGHNRQEFRLPQHHRDTALDWHGGQGSGLYSVGSSGRVNGNSARRALEEIDDIRNFPTSQTGLDNPHTRRPLDQLYDHLSGIENQTQMNNGEEFDRLLHELRSAPYEEPVPEKAK